MTFHSSFSDFDNTIESQVKENSHVNAQHVVLISQFSRECSKAQNDVDNLQHNKNYLIKWLMKWVKKSLKENISFPLF